MTTTLYGQPVSDEAVAINEHYKDRVRAEIKRLKGKELRHDNDELVAASEEYKAGHARLQAIRLGKPVVAEGEPAGPRKRKTWAADLVTAWVKDNLDKTFTPDELAAELGVSKPTVYSWISGNRSQLAKLGRGQYQVVDRSDERKRK